MRRPALGLAALAGLAVMILEGIRVFAPLAVFPQGLQSTFLGGGEKAFAVVSAADSGLHVLLGTVGWAGVLSLLGITGASLVAMNRHARRAATPSVVPAALGSAAMLLSLSALLAPGGLFIPSVNLAVALTMGLMPVLASWTGRPRSGLIPAAAAVLLVLFLGVCRDEGLVLWSVMAYGWGEEMLHVSTGFFLSLVLVWLLGARNGWLGLLGLVLAAAAGGAGELLQKLVSARGMEMGDWAMHLLGVAAAAPLYLLAIGSRGCESPDVRPFGALSEGRVDG